MRFGPDVFAFALEDADEDFVGHWGWWRTRVCLFCKDGLSVEVLERERGCSWALAAVDWVGRKLLGFPPLGR